MSTTEKTTVTQKIESEINSIDNGVFEFGILNSEETEKRIERTFFSFFRNDNKWSVELTLPRINNIWELDKIVLDKLLKNCTIALLEKFGIKLPDNCTSPLVIDEFNSDTSFPANITKVYKDCKRHLDTIKEKIVFIDDAPKIGKTQFMRFYCSKWKMEANCGQIWWLDFNGGAVDICDFLMMLYRHQFKNVNFIVIDNIECCGAVIGKRMIDFFVDLVDKINSKGKTLKLFVIHDKNRNVYSIENSGFSGKINCFSGKISNMYSDWEQKNINPKKELYDYIYENIKNDTYYILNSDEISDSEKRVFAKAILFARCGVNLKIEPASNLFKLITNKSPIKLMNTGEIIGYSANIWQRLVEDLQDLLQEILSEEFLSYKENVLEFYYNYRERDISLVDFHNILKSTDKTSKSIHDFRSILDATENIIKKIIDTVLCTGDGDRIFGNHLGAILFAAEALSAYAEKDWQALQAWLRLYDYVKSVFFIDGQENKLPEICYGKERIERTILDFEQGKEAHPKRNCLENQIKLQDEVLAQCSDNNAREKLHLNELNIIEIFNNLDDKLLNFYLSPIQKNTEAEIDMDKFFGTYILALLFEFEVAAPDNMRDDSRIKKLWAKIKHNCIESSDNGFDLKYFYPARIPWVTARMLLAMDMYRHVRNADTEITEEINSLIDGLTRYLEKCSITFEYEEKKYRFWTAGTGLWNSTLETSMMCAFSLSKTAHNQYPSEFDEAKRFINIYKKKWFDGKILADGIWAYQTTELDDLDSTTIFNKIVFFRENIAEYINTEVTVDKNDKSLGIGHIAKTLVDLVKKFVDVRPKLFSISDYSNDTEDHSIRESFGTTDNESNKQAEDNIVNGAITLVEEWIRRNNSSEHLMTVPSKVWDDIIEKYDKIPTIFPEQKARIENTKTFARRLRERTIRIDDEQMDKFKIFINNLADKVSKGTFGENNGQPIA